MKQIPLTRGKIAIVDDEDFEYLSQWKWFALKHGNKYYAMRLQRIPKTKTNIASIIHRVILGLGPNDKGVDHINGNGIDNRKENLRVCSQAENSRNRRLHSNNTSGYKGVFQSGKKWGARIKNNGKLLHLGVFSDKKDAARAYNEAAVKYFGEFARPNEIHDK